MRILSENSALHVYWQDLTYLEAALLAEEETAHLAPVVTEVLTHLLSVQQQDSETLRQLIQARARASVADARIDERIHKVHTNTLYHVNQDRKSKEFVRLFPESLSRLVRHALKKQVEITRAMLQTLGLDIYPEDFRTTQVSLLTSELARGEAALSARQEAEHNRTVGRLEVELWKEEANAVRNSVHAELLAIAAEARRKKAWAETFFA